VDRSEGHRDSVARLAPLPPSELDARRTEMRKSLTVTLTGLVAALAVAGGAAAAKSSSSLSLVVLGSDTSRTAATTAPSFGGEVTFDVATTQTDHPSVNVRCFQDGTWVYEGWQSFWPGAANHDPVFTLSSNYWNAGAADCTARLVYYDQRGLAKTLTSLDFHVGA